MEPTNNIPTTPIPIPEVVQKSPLPVIILTALICLIIGVVSTIGVIYYLELDFSKKESQNTNTPPTSQNTEEQTNNEVIPPKDDEVEKPVTIEYSKKILGIEYWKGQGVSATYQVLAPTTSKVTDEGTGTAPNKTLKYTDVTTGETELTFQIPHMGLYTTLDKNTKVESSLIKNLYRIQTTYSSKNTPKLYYYSNDIKLTGECKNGTEVVKAVCGLDQVIGLIVTATNSKGDFTVADKIISTLEVVK